MSVAWDIFWCKVFFKEYIKHYRKMTDEQIVKDVRQSMDDLEDLVDNTDSFGSQMVRWSVERAEQPFATAARNNGRKGGRPRKKQETTADGDIRDDSQAKPDWSAITRNETRAHDALEPSATNSATTPCTEQSTDKGRTGAPVRGAKSSTAPVRSSLAYAGRNGLVVLSDEDYSKVLQAVGNKHRADRLIDALDYKLAEGETFKQQHVTVLLRWNDWREEKAEESACIAKVKAEAQSKAGFKNTAEKNEDVIRELAEYYSDRENGKASPEFRLLEVAK